MFDTKALFMGTTLIMCVISLSVANEQNLV